MQSTVTRPKLKLTESERSALRHGPGFIGVVEFAPRAGRRGPVNAHTTEV